MTRRTSVKKLSKHFIPNFEARSVLLFAVLTMGAVAVTQAQNSPASLTTSHSSAPAQVALSETVGVLPVEKIVGRGAEAAFMRADSDGDGKLSRQEIEHFPALAQRFEQIDTNHDNFISPGEFNQAAGL
ncbi:MAG: EF-hand domain-containing protein [Polaromonas sp.]